MKLLFDQGLPRGAVPILVAAEIESVHVGEIGLATAKDVAILEYARRHGYVVVTLDADFHDILASTWATDPSVIRIRIERLKARDVANLLIQILPDVEADLAVGALVIIQTGRVRVRILPLLKNPTLD